jgi:hypothetical protein
MAAAKRRAGKSRLIAKAGKIRLERVTACIGCGCTDEQGCLAVGGVRCYWISVNRTRGVGMCSECAIAMFNAILFAEPSDAEISRQIEWAARS